MALITLIALIVGTWQTLRRKEIDLADLKSLLMIWAFVIGLYLLWSFSYHATHPHQSPDDHEKEIESQEMRGY